MVETGLSEEIEFTDSTSTDITTDFGSFAAASFIIDESTRREDAIGNNGKPIAIQDGTVENRATLTCKPVTLEVLKIMGDLDSQAGEITFPAKLPLHDSLKGQFTDSHRFELRNFKVGGFTLESGIDETVTIEFDPIQAETGEVQENTVADKTINSDALQWTDTDVKVNGSSFGIIESVTSGMDRNIRAEHSLGSGREPSAIVEGQFNIEPSFVIKIKDAKAWETLLDDTTYPLTVSDSRSPVNEISFDFGSGNGELVIENGKAEINEFEMDGESDDTRTIELSFEAENILIRGL